MIIAVSMGMGIALIGVIIVLSLTVAGELSFNPLSYMYTLFSILFVSFAVRFGSYKLMDRYL